MLKPCEGVVRAANLCRVTVVVLYTVQYCSVRGPTVRLKFDRGQMIIICK